MPGSRFRNRSGFVWARSAKIQYTALLRSISFFSEEDEANLLAYRNFVFCLSLPTFYAGTTISSVEDP